MKFTTILLPLLALSSGITASPVDISAVEEPSTIEARQAKEVNFKITKFYNYGRPHSFTSFIGFTVENPAAKVKASCTASQSRNIATTPYYTRCDKPGVGFGFTDVGGGYVLTIGQRYNKNKSIDIASLFIPDEHVKRSNNRNDPNGNFDYIDYPENFTLRANSFVVGAVHGPARDV
ncbi:hypothetical protein TWF281_008945 [Arthrobotrys megalospora]